MQRLAFFCFFLIMVFSRPLASAPRQLTLDSAVDIAINNSYRTKMLRLEIERSIYSLQARKASLHTQAYMRLKSPDLQNVSDHKWNSTLGRDEIVRVNSTLWQSDISLLQPVILFGYPTNGYLSLNYKVYQYEQRDDGRRDRDLYNRLYLQFEQPLFLPNELKNDLEEAELNLLDVKLDYISERIEIIRDIADDFYDIFALSYHVVIHQNHLEFLRTILPEAEAKSRADAGCAIEPTQIELEITNATENQLSVQSDLRRQFADLKQRLRLPMEDSLYVAPVVEILPITVNPQLALEMGLQNNPDLKRLHISKRRSEIDVENVRGNNATHLTIEATYGLEKNNHKFASLWRRFDNSNSVTLNAYVPLWDGGVRKNNIEAEKTDLIRRELEIEEQREDIGKDVNNIYQNLNEFYQRAVNMYRSVELSNKVTGSSIAQYANGDISLQDLLQIVNRHKETESKFLAVYLDYRRSLVELTTETFFNFEKNIPLTEELDLIYEE